MINLLAKLTIVVSLACALPAAGAAAGKRDGRHAHPRAHPRVDAQQTGSIPGGGHHHRRDPLGIIQGQGVSSLHGGMGNMGGGSGRSANTGVGLGAHGNSQGPRH